MIDIILEGFRTAATASILGFLLVTGWRLDFLGHRGWRFICSGFGLLFLGSVAGIAGFLGDRYLVVGDLLGFVLLAAGIWHGLPAARRLKWSAAAGHHREDLEAEFARRTRALEEANDRLQREVGERQRAVEALEARKRQLRDFATASGDWFWETDSEHRFVWVSDRVKEKSGVPAAYHIGKSRLELAADGADQEKWRAHLQTLQAGRPFRDFRYLRQGHDGRLQHMSTSGVPVFDDAGTFKGYRGTGTDITAIVEAEVKAAGAQNQFMAAIESVSDGFALFDADDRMVFCNSRFKELNPELARIVVPGITFEEMLKDNIACNRILDALGDEEAFVRQRMEQHRNPSGALVQQRKDGRWLELREERTPEGSTFLVNTDISERKRAEEALLAAKEQAERANHTKSEFLALMSHELRTPLNAIIGFSETMRAETFGPVGSPKYREYANDIHASGRHLLELINDILDLSKVESGSGELHEEEIEIPAAIGSVLTLVKERADRAGIRLETDLPEALPALRADNRKLKQILVNLLCNAIKFTDADGRVLLRVRSRTDSGCVFQIIDTGIGIALEDIPKALTPFKQVGDPLNRRHEGTGLGLPLTKSLVEMHGGSLDLQSELGVGTTVTLRFPAERLVPRPAAVTFLPLAPADAGA